MDSSAAPTIAAFIALITLLVWYSLNGKSDTET